MKLLNEKQLFQYDVDMLFSWGWDTYRVNATCTENARYEAAVRVRDELGEDVMNTIKVFDVRAHGSMKVLSHAEIQ